MKTSNALVTFLAAASALLSGIFGVAPAVQAQQHPNSATHCVVIRAGDFMAQEIYNRCNRPIEVAWCFYKDNNCVRFDSRTTVSPGWGYPIPAGQLVYAACPGKNSIDRISGTAVRCQ